MRILLLSNRAALARETGDIGPIQDAFRAYCQRHHGHDIRMIFHDERVSRQPPPVKSEPQAIRRYIGRLESSWGAIECVVLVGGEKVMPFFSIANPCNDDDACVLSDNPYASRDDDVLIPERICARLPDNRSARYVADLLERDRPRTDSSFGLTAKVWIDASREVYRTVGTARTLRVSPPTTADNLNPDWLRGKCFLYFNVHGSDVTANWYGQNGDQYPVVLHPGLIAGCSGIAASEACYGASITGKSADNSICLRLLKEPGVTAFCGSTTIAYGPPAPPSGEADLLVRYFFEYLKQGLTAGESFRNAKVDFARKALRQHGFLDEDDRKTLLQFVLYGDPLARSGKEDQ